MTYALLPAPDVRPPAVGRESAHAVCTRLLGREVLRMAGMLALYEGVRSFAGRDAGAALRHAHDVVRLESWLHLPSEASLQAPVLHLPELVRAMNVYYATIHLPATALTLVWLFVRHREQYLWIRRSLFAATGAALGAYLLVPVAPPRMLPGIVDTGLEYGQSVYGKPGARSFADQYAAMPSLHVGWAVIVAVALLRCSRSRWRWVWLIYPAVTALVVVATGNHYWLDALAGALLALVALAACQDSTRASLHRAYLRRRHPWTVRRAELADIPACARLLAPSTEPGTADPTTVLPALRLFLTHVALDQADLWVTTDRAGTVREATLDLPPLDQLDTHGYRLALSLHRDRSADWPTPQHHARTPAIQKGGGPRSRSAARAGGSVGSQE